MRFILLLLMAIITVSGCVSSESGMYHVPTQSKVSVRSQNMYTVAKHASSNKPSNKSQVTEDSGEPVNTNSQKPSKKIEKKSTLNNAMSVSAKIIGGIFRGVKKLRS